MTKKRVTVHYRRLTDRKHQTIKPDCRDCLETALAASIDGVKLGDVDASRVTSAQDGRKMCLLSPALTKDLAFGEIAVFRDGDVPIAETTDQGEVKLRTISLNEKEEAILGSSYFLANGPHLALLHQESSTRFVRDYFNWFLRKPLGGLDADEIINLMPMAMAGGKLVGLKDVKTLKLRGEVDLHAELPVGDGAANAQTTFSRFIERRPLNLADGRGLMRLFGLTDGTLKGVSDQDLEDLEFELIVKKREKRNLEILPDSIISGVMSDGLDMAAEFETVGARRRGNAVVMSHVGEVDLDGAYFEHGSVRTLLLGALTEWGNQGLI